VDVDGGRLRGKLAGWRGDAPLAMQCQGVHGDDVADEVEELATWSAAWARPEPAAVVECAVDRLGICAAG
jgi:hypothetical protein